MSSSNESEHDPYLYQLFDRLNHTELLQIAQRNHVVLPNYSRDALIRIIIGEESPPQVVPEIDRWRRAIMLFLIDHRKVLETQIHCPAKSFQEDACFGCLDAQVLHCLTSNGAANYQLIELHKKKVP